jgi:hypothetical protein
MTSAIMFLCLLAIGSAVAPTLWQTLWRLYRHFAKWPRPTDWAHPAGRIRRPRRS